jgi:hypothetical protein
MAYLGNRLISKNPTQIPKIVTSKNGNFKESEIGFLSFEHMENKIKAIGYRCCCWCTVPPYHFISPERALTPFVSSFLAISR